MKFWLLFLLVAFSMKSLYGQDQFIDLNGGSWLKLDDIQVGKKRIFLFISSKSCTGCKDNLNLFLKKIDTTACSIIIVRSLINNSNLVKRELSSDLHNYFEKFNLIVFEPVKMEVKTPFIKLMNCSNGFTDIEYQVLFDGVEISKKAERMMSQFLPLE